MRPDRFGMEKTTEPRQATDQAADATPAPDERARARAYLDLWERNLVLTAMDGPAPRQSARRP
jgi:hypothetical protein